MVKNVWQCRAMNGFITYCRLPMADFWQQVTRMEWALGLLIPIRNIYLIKTDANGNLQWSKTYGTSTGNQQAFGHCLQPTTDGGYIVTGQAGGYFPCCGNVQSDSGIFLMKIDDSGNMKWAKYFSGEFGHAVKQTADNGYIIAGTGNYGGSNRR